MDLSLSQILLVRSFSFSLSYPLTVHFILILKIIRTATVFNFCQAGFCAILITFSFL